jgi:hypothetical protein
VKIEYVVMFLIGVVSLSSCRLFDALDESGYSRQGKLTLSPNTIDLSGSPQRVGTIITFKGQYFAPANDEKIDPKIVASGKQCSASDPGGEPDITTAPSIADIPILIPLDSPISISQAGATSVSGKAFLITPIKFGESSYGQGKYNFEFNVTVLGTGTGRACFSLRSVWPILQTKFGISDTGTGISFVLQP